MRKVFWCCLVAGAAVCCALGAAVYVLQCPDSALGRFALTVTHTGGAELDHPGAPNREDLIPPDPVPVEEPSEQPAPPALPGSAPQLPPAVTALIPPIIHDIPLIIIHDEEDLNGASSLAAKTEAPAAVTTFRQTLQPSAYDIDEIGRRIDGDAAVEPKAGAPRMPYCIDDSGPAATMPGCTDDGAVPVMPPAGDEGTVGRGMRRPDAWAWWLGFFSGPTQLTRDPSAGRCEEDPHYGQQYPGVPYTGRVGSTEPPARGDVKTPAFPGVEETSEPAPVPHMDPRQLLSHPHRLQTPRPTEPQSDTMEMRPSDWKPYSLEPGPF